jgi:hypothetical protein
VTLASRIAGRFFRLPPRTNRVTVERDIKVPMPDGTFLLTDHYAPIGAEPRKQALNDQVSDQGKSDREVRRCLKRHLPRRIFELLQRVESLYERHRRSELRLGRSETSFCRGMTLTAAVLRTRHALVSRPGGSASTHNASQ